MCLHPDGIKKATKKTGFGYKVFEQDKYGRLFGICVDMGVERRQGEWLQSANHYYITTPISYRDANIGFHIYLHRKDAEPMLEQVRCQYSTNAVLRRVEYHGAHHVGLGDGGWNRSAQVVVANEMFIIKKNGRARCS